MQNFDLQKYLGNNPLLEDENSNSEDFLDLLNEGLTEDESKAVLDKYKKRYAAVLKSNPDFIKKYSNPDKVIYGMIMNEIKKLREKQKPLYEESDDTKKLMDDWKDKLPALSRIDSKDEFVDLIKSVIEIVQSVSPGFIKSSRFMAAMGELYSQRKEFQNSAPEQEINEKLGKDADLGDHIEDFTKSNAKQFQGKSKKKIRQMATAAFLNKEEQKLDEIDAMMEDAQEKSEKNYSNYFKKMDKNRLNELVKTALMGPVKEANAFIKAADDARDDGKKEFEFPKGSGKMHKVTIQAKIDETDMSGRLIKKIADAPNFLHKLIKDMKGLKNKDGSPITTGQIISQLKLKMTPAEVEAIKEVIKEDKVKSLTERIFNELREEKFKLTSAEQKIFDDITESLNEGVLDFEKIKQYAKKGLMTAAILLSLNTTGFSTDQQQKISDIVKTEMPASKKTEVDRMHKISVVTTALQQYKRGKKLDKLDDSLKQDLEDIKNGPKNVDQVVNIFDFHQDALKEYVPFMF